MKELRIIVFLLVISVQFASAQRQVIDKVIATVGSELVLLSEIQEQIAYAASNGQEIPEGAECVVLDQILATKLLINQAKLDSLIVSDEEVENQLDARMERILAFMNGSREQFEAYYGQTVEQMKDQFREDLRNQILSQRMNQQIMANVSVTPSEVKDFFSKIERDSLPYFNSEVEIGEVVYKPILNDEEKQKVVVQLTDIKNQIEADEVTFEDMAMKFSQDGTARLGGDLGWATRGKYVQEFEAAAYKLEQDEISPVVETEFGYHLIQMLGRRGNSIRLRHILIRPELTDEDLKKAELYLDSIRTLIVRDTLNFSYAVKRYSNEDVQSYNNDGRMVNPITGNTFFEIGDLEPDVYFAIDTMSIGSISKPFEFRAQGGGDRYFRIVQLQSRTNPHVANLATDYSKIQKAAIEAKKSDFINDWIKGKVDATFININPVYVGCPELEKWAGKRSAVVKP
ncbi:MAG: peptidylprolyl isomerase [Bacteroidota bacterium]